MLDPDSTATGRALLIFAAIVFCLGLYLGLAQQRWTDARLWLALAVFLGCYGALTVDLLPRRHRELLAIGLAAGGVALWQALRLVFGG